MMTSAILAVLAAATLYQNDFSTRTSADKAPNVEWASYTYCKGGPLAYNYNPMSTKSLSMAYSWENCQNGWTKVYGKNVKNWVYSFVSDEADPALTFAGKDDNLGGATTTADHEALVMHPIRNVFLNGDVRVQFDVRQPVALEKGVNCWLRLEYEDDIKDAVGGGSTAHPFELGFAAKSLSGGWRAEGQSDGQRTYYSSFASSSMVALHWYRYYVTCHLDTNTFDFKTYHLGASRLAMDVEPADGLLADKTGCLFRQTCGPKGGISGIMIRCNYADTKGLPGDATYDEDRAPKFDNIRVSWKKPGASAFEDCYRNDFSTCKRRTIDGSPTASHTYATTETADSLTFAYDASLVREYTTFSTPYLTAPYDEVSRKGKVQPVGVDGWRICGNGSFQSPAAVTTNGANRLLTASSGYAKFKQPMCPEVTSGKVKFEFDARMPRGWNGTPRYEVDLLSAAAYEDGTDNVADRRTGVGPCATTGDPAGTDAVPVETFSVYINGAYKSQSALGSVTFEPLTWYRYQQFIDLTTKKAELFIYKIGSSAPSAPEDFTDSTDTNKALIVFRDISVASPSGFAGGIAAYGVSSWARSRVGKYAATEMGAYIDNVRFWKQENDDWTLLFQNDFTNCKRLNFTRKSAKLTGSYFDRPEYSEDGFITCPTVTDPVQVTGENQVLQFRDYYNVFAQSLGRNIRSGMWTAQFDVRLPNYWAYDRFQFELGGGTLASASMYAEPYRYNLHSAIVVNFRKATSTGTSGVASRARYLVIDGPGDKGWLMTNCTENSGEEFDFAKKWIRVKITADVTRKTFDVGFYDMGTTHPTFDTAEGVCLLSHEGLQFHYADEPISHLLINGGKTVSYQPWLDEAPGALLVDNIRVGHDKSGVLLIVR